MSKQVRQEIMAQTTPLSPMEVEAAKASSHQEVVASDVLIPRLLLGQGTSPMVTQRKAQLGDMVRSTTLEKLGDPEHPLEIIPIKMTNSWILFETAKSAKTQQPAFRGQEERNASNETLPWEFKQEGKEMFRRKAITLFALVPSDVAAYSAEIERAVAAGEAPDLNRTTLPLVVTFQSTAFKHAGKKCASFFNNVRVSSQRVPGLAAFQYVLPLISRQEQSGANTWYVFDMGAPKPLKDKGAREEAARWATILNQGSVRVDDTGEIHEETAAGVSTGEMEV